MTRAFPSTGEDDIVVLQADPYCDTPYTGAFKQATVFVIGYTTPEERIFKRKDRTAALMYARAGKLTFDSVVAGACCHHLMVDLLGS